MVLVVIVPPTSSETSDVPRRSVEVYKSSNGESKTQGYGSVADDLILVFRTSKGRCSQEFSVEALDAG